MSAFSSIRHCLLAGLAVSLAAAQAHAALVAYYPFENDLTDVVGSYNGTESGGGPFTYVSGYSGQAVDLSGSNQFATLTTGSDLGLGGNFTVSVFINSDDLSGDRTVLGNDGASGNQTLHLITRANNAHLGFFGNDQGGNANLSIGTWTHVAYQFKSGSQSIFVNGVLDASSGGHAAFGGAANNVLLGRWGAGNYFDGRIDNLTVYNSALSSNQIAHLASGGDPQALPTPTLDWDFRNGNLNGWTAVNGTIHYRAGDGGGVTPADGGGGFAHDGGHTNLVFRSPSFKFTGGTFDGTNVISVDWAGGQGDQENNGPSFANPAAVVAHNGGNSNSVGEKAVAILDTVTGQYVGWVFNSGDGNAGITSMTLAQFNLLSLDLSRQYQLDFYENDDGGWGWGQMRQVAVAAVPEPSAAALCLMGLGLLTLRFRRS